MTIIVKDILGPFDNKMWKLIWPKDVHGLMIFLFEIRFYCYPVIRTLHTPGCLGRLYNVHYHTPLELYIHSSMQWKSLDHLRAMLGNPIPLLFNLHTGKNSICSCVHRKRIVYSKHCASIVVHPELFRPVTIIIFPKPETLIKIMKALCQL